jgi:predicted enzyme related to lactoylglutathione lyase
MIGGCVEKVKGIGGVFLKAKNPEMMAVWYETHLGISFEDNTYAILKWRESMTAEQNPVTVFSFFPEGSSYFAPSTSQFMMNFRVNNLDAMLEQLKNAGVEVMPEITEDESGRFGRILDPEGNKIELWQPASEM